MLASERCEHVYGYQYRKLSAELEGELEERQYGIRRRDSGLVFAVAVLPTSYFCLLVFIARCVNSFWAFL